MQEKLVEYSTAVLAKEKGFNHLKANVYGDNMAYDTGYEEGKLIVSGNALNSVLAPTQSLLQKWLREVHNIDIYCSPDYKKLSGDRQKVYDCMCVICKTDSPKMLFHMGDFPTFEEALEEGLQTALNLLP